MKTEDYYKKYKQDKINKWNKILNNVQNMGKKVTEVKIKTNKVRKSRHTDYKIV